MGKGKPRTRLDPVRAGGGRVVAQGIPLMLQMWEQEREKSQHWG